MKKRRLLSIVLSLCMVLALMPQMVFADVPTGTPLTKESVSDGTLSLTSGNSYYLSEDIEITETINISGTVTLDLNGHVIKMTGGNSVIKVNTHSNFILLDSDSNTGHNGEYASLPTGGVITSDGIPSFGGGVSVDNYGSFTMKGGTIYDCHAISAGGGVFVEDGSFTMEGGVIDDCGAPLGGSVFVEDGRFTMEGGLIDSGNDFASNSISVGYKSTFNANGGVVKSFVELIAQIQNTSTDGCTEFYGLVSNEKNSNSQYIGTISGGIYYGVVRNRGTISGGVFYGGIVNQGGTITEPYHTVSFDLNDGNDSIPTQWFVNINTAQALKPADPTKDGYKFTGWYTDEALNNLYNFDMPVDDELILYAGWEEEKITLTVPFTTTVELGGNASPGETTFNLEVVDSNGAELQFDNVEVTAAVTTNGKGTYDGEMIITGPIDNLEDMLGEGAYVRQVNDGEAYWTYDDTVWGLFMEKGTANGNDDIVAMAASEEPDADAASNYYPIVFATTCEDGLYNMDMNAGTVDEMTFTNKYTRSAAAPADSDSNNGSAANTRTGDDSSLALWLALLAVSAAGLIGTGVYSRRRKSSQSE